MVTYSLQGEYAFHNGFLNMAQHHEVKQPYDSYVAVVSIIISTLI